MQLEILNHLVASSGLRAAKELNMIAGVCKLFTRAARMHPDNNGPTTEWVRRHLFLVGHKHARWDNNELPTHEQLWMRLLHLSVYRRNGDAWGASR